MSNAEVQQETLANGLHIIAEYHPQAKSSSLGFFVRTGARDESPRESGVSHFLEHMMFKGTAKRNALEITFQLGNIGAQANAFTSEENTVYYASVMPKYFSAAQELLSDMLRPAIDPAEFETEKKVILEEIALYQDRPQFYLFEHATKDYFGDHSAGNSVLGSQQSIADLKRDEMAEYFRRRYSADNITLVASGNFDWRAFFSDAKKYCANWQAFAPQRDAVPYTGNKIRKVYKKKNLTQVHLLFVCPGASAEQEERYAMSLLATMLGDSSGSRFYWELIDSGLADSAGADNDEKQGTGCFMAYASTELKNAPKVEQVMRDILDTPLEFSDADLERAKNKVLTRVVLGGELPMGRLMALGNEWLYRKRIHSLRETIEKVRALSRSDIERALKIYPLKKWAEFKLEPEAL